MKHFEVTYALGNQKTFEPFPDTPEGIKSAMRAIKKRERLGWSCTPSLIVLKHKLKHLDVKNL